MALKITKDDYMVKAGLQLKEIPEEREWKEDLVKVSLMWNRIEGISRATSPKCPKLSTLILRSNPLKLVSDSFFLQMRGLHVLNLSHTEIEYLPSSISDLAELNALLLSRCYKLMFVPPLGNLKALKELDISNTVIKEIPQGVESLTNLKCLDTIGSRIVKISLGILQGLSLLQRLTLPRLMTIPIKEVAGLKQLEEIQGKFGLGKMITFGIDCLKKVERGKDEITMPRNIERVHFYRCGLCSCLFDDIQQLNNATELKHYYVGNKVGIEFIVRLSLEKELTVEEEQQFRLMPLHYLESLCLENLLNFIGLIRWEVAPAIAPLPHGLFSHLRSLTIRYCRNIKKLLPQSLVQNLHKLEEPSVNSCAKMEEIIGDDESDGGFVAKSNTNITLPRLKFLQLINLLELKSICKGTIICNSIVEIRIKSITKVRKVPLFLPPLNGQPSPPPSLKNIKLWEKDKGWWESLEWDQPNANSVLHPFLDYVWNARMLQS
ncbi:Disease resistance protein RPS2 [Olea europaea subsp. europaea]|uniref:Disease resistance protein RPS2 n=1 Tax=Olea europaea subsp. europaea TaxID=158383 RepID=A0A8S0VI17_OLEEU|nr:Disease resistance protein RPS2 [Olea europaea subsp. europaea]